jgi:hypothetical protein
MIQSACDLLSLGWVPALMLRRLVAPVAHGGRRDRRSECTSPRIAMPIFFTIPDDTAGGPRHWTGDVEDFGEHGDRPRNVPVLCATGFSG